MKKHSSVVRKVLLAVASILSIITVIVALTITSERAETVEQSVLSNIKATTNSASDKIHEFFRERSRVVTSLVGNSFVNHWFENYTERGSEIDSDPNYQQMVKLFKNVSLNDKMIKSVFYAPASTHEYFDLNGRYNDDNYYTSKRPWWGQALKRDRLFITKPEIDANDGSIVTSIKSTVYNDDKQLLGVLGIDVLASEVKSKLVETMKYQGLGYGFLYSSDGQIISFPDKGKRIDMSKLPKLSEVDTLFSHADGFTELLNVSASKTNTIRQVTWQNENYVVVVSSIIDETMELDWRIALMVPESVISGPVNDSIISSIIVVILMVVITSGVTVFAIKKLLTNPLMTIVEAMDDIATGDGDLTQRIHMDRNDELGRLSHSFNVFVENIQSIIKQCSVTTNKVLHESDDVSHLVEDFAQNVSQQKGYIEQIATAATEMTQTIHGISENAQSALDHATKATEESADGRNLAVSATNLMGELSSDVATAANVVSDLHKNSESITAMLEVIKGIAEQTNLLALNAAIEAARAGEQGRGFAVVADEVRTLASRTQDSAADIEDIIAKLHQSAEDAVQAMNVGKDKTDQGVVLINEVNDKLTQIGDAISLIEEQSNETALTTREQASASDEISRQTVAVNELADTTVTQTEEMSSKSEVQREITLELNKTMTQFIV